MQIESPDWQVYNILDFFLKQNQIFIRYSVSLSLPGRITRITVTFSKTKQYILGGS